MAYRDEVLTDSPVDYYEMETSTGTDSGSGARTLTLAGGVTTGVTGNTGNGWSFDGVNDSASAASFPSITGSLSIEAWVKAPSNGGWSNDYQTFVRRDGTDIVLIRGRGSNITGGVQPGKAEVYIAGSTIYSTNRIDDGNWHQVVLTVQGTAAKLYVDGALSGSVTTAKTTYSFGTGSFYVGSASGTGEFYKGSMDNVSIYNTVQNSTRIATRYSAGTITNVAVDVETPTSTNQTIEPTVEGHGKVTTITDDSTYQNGSLYSTTSSTLNVGGSANVYNIRFVVPKASISGTNITASQALLWLYKDSLSGGVTVGVYRTANNVKQGAAITTFDAATPTTGTWFSIDVTSIVQDAFDNGRTNIEIGLFAESGTGLLGVRSSDATVPTAQPYLETRYVLAPVNVTLDVSTVTATGQAVEPAIETHTNIDLTVEVPTATAQTTDATVENGVATDVPTATGSALANDVTVDTVVSPNVAIDVETATASAVANDVVVGLPMAVDVETPTASAQANDVTAESVSNAVIELDTPSLSTNVIKLTDVNGEPIVPTETEDSYFVSTLRTVDTGDIWWRLNEASGTKVYNRANPATEWPGTGTGTYQGVTIGQFNGPEGRRSVYFNGTALIEENEPTASNLDEVFYSPNVLEFTFRTERGTQFIMGGADSSGVAVGSGVSSPIEASEFWLVDGRINFRAYRMSSTTPQLNTNITGFQNLADGKWHHVVINAGVSNPGRGTRAIEIWVDGKLEIRRFAGVTGTSANETLETSVVYFGSPDYIGGRPEFVDGRRVPTLPVSQWFLGDMTEVVFRNNKVLSEDQILLQRDNMFGIVPIYVETARASVQTDDATAKGNKVRVLVINFQTGSSMTMNQSYAGIGPEPGKDVFGRVVNAPPYTAQFQFSALTSALGDTYALDAYQFFSVPVRNNYTDPVTDNERLLDLDVDVNMDDYDILAIGGYPLNDGEMSWFTVMDAYSTPPYVPARTQLENLMAQIRQKVIGGKRLFVNDPGSAVALGIVDRVEYVPVMRERAFNDARVGSLTGYYDQRGRDIDPWGLGQSPDRYRDEHANQIQRVRKVIDGLTTIPSYIITDYFEWYNTDPMATPPQQGAKKFADRTNGLSIGDEFYMQGAQGPSLLDWFDEYDGTPTTGSRASGWLAAPIANIKAGSAVTSFAPKVWNKDKADDNPYKDHAVSIVIEPGDSWAGQTVQGKAYVNFTEAWTHWAGYHEIAQKQKIVTTDPQHPQTAEQNAWDFSTYRGTWTGTTINPNQASGGGEIKTSGTSGGVEGQKLPDSSSDSGVGPAKPTRKPNITSLVTFVWKSWPGWDLEPIDVLSMANRGLRWLASDVENDGNANVSVETPTAEVKALEPAVEAARTAVVDVPTARAVAESYDDADTVSADVSVLVSTPTATVVAGAFREVVDLSTATATATAIEPESDLLNGLEIIRLVLPRHSVTLYMEET